MYKNYFHQFQVKQNKKVNENLCMNIEKKLKMRELTSYSE